MSACVCVCFSFRHQGKNKPNQMMQWALSYAVQNRINCRSVANDSMLMMAREIEIHVSPLYDYICIGFPNH